MNKFIGVAFSFISIIFLLSAYIISTATSGNTSAKVEVLQTTVTQLENDSADLDLALVVEEPIKEDCFTLVNRFITSDYAIEHSNMFDTCLEYLTEFEIIKTKLAEAYGTKSESLLNFFYLKSDYVWNFNGEEPLSMLLEEIRQANEIPASNGKYIELQGKIALTEDYSYGANLNISKSLDSFYSWLENPTGNNLLLETNQYVPSILSSGKEVFDFTQILGFGQTRIDLIRNGMVNDNVYYAELGLEEIDNKIVYPNEEFSYIKSIGKFPGLNITSSGRIIGCGYCNSTTTLFRALLHAGLPITDRASHGILVPSYEWGPYPYNIVDATFFAQEGLEVDLRFINNFPSPILIEVNTEKGSDGFQYHTVYIRGSKDSKVRTVELYDWEISNVQSASHFDGKFKRKVLENGEFLFQDEFYSKYR